MAVPHSYLDAWREVADASAWRRELRRKVRKDEAVFLRKNTRRGWPLASDRMVAKFEKLLGRRLRPLPAGRPKGAQDKKKRKRRQAKELE